MIRKTILLHRIGLTGFLFLIAFAGISLVKREKQPVSPGQGAITGKGIVVLELFTSQGCSSCPPADAVLAGYAMLHDARIIPLSFHVDYWDRLGWTDPFSSPAWTDRQQWYSQSLPGHGIYTPQLVVNGTTETVGSNREAIRKMVDKQMAVPATSAITIDEAVVHDHRLGLHYSIDNSHKEQWLHIVLVQQQATTPVRAGENKGAALSSHNIVRSFLSKDPGPRGEETLDLPASFAKGQYAVVLYLQNKRSRYIEGAAMRAL
ncbi:MAG: DUF1223 domain-containing protein [Sediminibacterium sp.]